jgi:serine/threonine protein phosphatase PrpC
VVGLLKNSKSSLQTDFLHARLNLSMNLNAGYDIPRQEPQILQQPIRMAESHVSKNGGEIAKNEDSSFMRTDGSFGVFDGVGSSPKGRDASRLASSCIQNRFANSPKGMSEVEAIDFVEQSMLEANRMILEKSGGQQGWETTGTVVNPWVGPNGEKKAIVGHIGDSRLYRFRNGELEQITVDDSVGMMEGSEYDATNRILQEKLSQYPDGSTLTPYEKALFDKRNIITKSLGEQGVTPKMYSVDLLAGDMLVACSDGASDPVIKDRMRDIVRVNYPDASKTVNAIIDAALEESKKPKAENLRAKPDDISVVVSVEAQVFSTGVVAQERQLDPARGPARLGMNHDKRSLSHPPVVNGESVVQKLSRSRFENARTVQDFYDVLDTFLGGIQGRTRVEPYSTQELKEQVYRAAIARTEEERIDLLRRMTNSEGLRMEAARIFGISAEKLRG